MPARKLFLPSSKRHIIVFDEDWEFLTAHFGPESGNKMGVGHVIRTIIHDKILRMKAKANEALDRAKAEESSEDAADSGGGL